MIYFSLIIPYRNIPDLLERCLSSIPQRADIQIIVVDDNSDSDRRNAACRVSALYNAEFFVSKNSSRRGAGFARNIGLEHAKGKWLIFADADDFFLPDFDKMLDKYRDSDADMICFSNICADSDDISKEKEHPHFDMHTKIAAAIRHCVPCRDTESYPQSSKDTGDSDFRQNDGLDIIRYNTGVVWCRFIKRDLVEKNNIKFQETFCRNDTFFAVQTGCKANKIILDDTNIYCYTQRKDSLLSAFETGKGQKTRYFTAKTVMQYLRKQRKGFEQFNGDLLFHYNLLRQQHKLLHIRELLPVLFLTTTRKAVIHKFKPVL